MSGATIMDVPTISARCGATTAAMRASLGSVSTSRRNCVMSTGRKKTTARSANAPQAGNREQHGKRAVAEQPADAPHLLPRAALHGLLTLRQAEAKAERPAEPRRRPR